MRKLYALLAGFVVTLLAATTYARSVTPDVANFTFTVNHETKGGTNPYFATGAGGVIQALLMGFGGLDITPKGIIQIKTALPKNWKSLMITGVGPEKKTFAVGK